mmetsp:Transcript_3688/g.5341  ORF Transcript_3688/g.5341 Transcript_3688/m.5341 type:complete len:331 (+) Transcript_3688:178-1170(+)
MRTDTTPRRSSPISGGDEDSSIRDGQRQPCSSEESNIIACNSRNCRSLWVQGLQEGWGWTSPGKTSQFNIGREGIGRRNQSGRMRLPGRMWLRAQPRHRWKDCQLRQGERRSHQSTRIRERRVIPTRISTLFTLMLLFNYAIMKMTTTVDGFGLIGSTCNKRFGEQGFYGQVQSGRTGDTISSTQLQGTDDNFDDMEDNLADDDIRGEGEGDKYEAGEENIDFTTEIDQNADLPSPIEDLSWRVEKLRLEEANTRRFLKAGPRFLPYNEASKWVQAWDRWDCEDDWVRWIDEGEKRNSYIPARPDEYYGKQGKWISWDHFLGKNTTEDFQ